MVRSPVNTLMQNPNTHFTILEMVLHSVLSRKVGDIADTTENPKKIFIHGAKKCADKKEMELVVPSMSKLYELAVVFMFLPILIECLLWQMTLTVCAGIGDVFDLKEITSILNAASKVMSMMLAILLCTMAMMTISTVVVLMMGGAVQ